MKNEEKKTTELSSRFYAIAWFVFVLIGVILYVFWFPNSQNGIVPFVGLTISNPEHLVRVLFYMLVIGVVALDCEWIRYRHCDKNIADWLCLIFAQLSFMTVSLVTYPALVNNTSLSDVSRWRLLIILLLGMFSGHNLSMMYNSFLCVRDKNFSQKTGATRIPISSKVILTLGILTEVIIVITIIVLDWLRGHISISWSLIFFIIPTIYFLVRDQITSPPQAIENMRKAASRFDNIIFEEAVSGFVTNELLRGKSVDDENCIRRIREITRDSYRTINVELHDQLDIPICYQRDKVKNGDSVRVSCHAVGADIPDCDINIPLEFVYEAFFRLREEGLTNETQLVKESVFWATIFAFLEAEYRDYPKERLRIIYDCSSAGFPFMVSLLLKIEKCDLNDLLPRGWTPLLAAAAQNEPEIAKTLLDYGADPNRYNLKHITPLMYAARYNHHKVCEVLLENFSDLNLQDEYGSSALIVAVKNNSVEVFDMLLNAGADLTIKDNNGKTALDWAYQNGYGAMAKKIKAKMNI